MIEAQRHSCPPLNPMRGTISNAHANTTTEIGALVCCVVNTPTGFRRRACPRVRITVYCFSHVWLCLLRTHFTSTTTTHRDCAEQNIHYILTAVFPNEAVQDKFQSCRMCCAHVEPPPTHPVCTNSPPCSVPVLRHTATHNCIPFVSVVGLIAITSSPCDAHCRECVWRGVSLIRYNCVCVCVCDYALNILMLRHVYMEEEEKLMVCSKRPHTYTLCFNPPNKCFT